MKTYYLHLTEAEFTKDGSTWTSGTIDLYDNTSAYSQMATPSYINYSITKSAYGLDSLGDKTWTGMSDTAPGVTNSGYIKDGRFVDTSARIDVLTWEIEYDTINVAGSVSSTLSMFSADDPTLNYPDDWVPYHNNPISENNPIYWAASARFVKFVLDFTSTFDVASLPVDLYIRVAIDVPTMAPLYSQILRVVNKFPEWMDIRELNTDVSTPALATPNSLGGKVLNAIAGEWLDSISRDLNYVQLQRFISSVDTSQVAWVYRATDIPNKVIKVFGDGTRLANAESLNEFYAAESDQDVYWWDENTDKLYTRKAYALLTINDIEYVQNLHQIWNWFDEHGLSVDLYRHRGESNSSFKGRILDVYRNKPGVGVEAFKLALRRELNLWLTYGATPDSDYVGATPTVLEILDIEQDDDYVQPDGMPTRRFEDLVHSLADKYPTTWGYFKWGEANWDTAGSDKKGYHILPFRYDAESLSDDQVHSGVGDKNDLYLYRPDAVTGPHEFDATFKLRGRHRTYHVEYPEVKIDFDFYGKAERKFYTNPSRGFWINVVAHVYEMSAIDMYPSTPPITDTHYYANIYITNTNDIDVNMATPSISTFSSIHTLYLEDRYLSPQYDWMDANGNHLNGATPYLIETVHFVPPSQLWYLIASDGFKIGFGKYDPATDTYSDYPDPTWDIDMWFSSLDTKEKPSQILNTYGYNGTDKLISQLTDAPNVYVSSNDSHYDVGEWNSDHHPFVAHVNGVMPEVAEGAWTIDTPTIIWDNYLEPTPPKTYVVKLTNIVDGKYVGVSKDSSGNIEYIDSQYIYVNGSNAWVDGKIELPEATTQLTFTVNAAAAPNYPASVPVWSLFEMQQLVPVAGVVDQNGPWKNGKLPQSGNTNFNLQTVELERDDFAIPNTNDYIVTWMGVENNDPRVLTWLDVNTIKPAVADPGVALAEQYSPDAIEEFLNVDTGKYYYSPVVLKARLRPDLDAHWYPQMHSGVFYDQNEEYYSYASAGTQTATVNDFVLPSVARQGAPIIVATDQSTPKELRHVAFIDDNYDLTLVNKETLKGNGTNYLYLAYEDVYSVSVEELETGLTVSADSSTYTNALKLNQVSNKDYTYEVSYKVRYSFISQNDIVDSGGNQKTKLTFDITPSQATPYVINWEESKFDPATPIDVPLNTFYTVYDEGFVFLSHNEYDIAKIEVRLDPGQIIADGHDYMFISLRSLDAHGNPKPNQILDVTSSYGTFDEFGSSVGSITTDNDGFATLTLSSEPNTVYGIGTLSILGDAIDETIEFDILPVATPSNILLSIVEPDAIPADGLSAVVVHGRLEDNLNRPIPQAYIRYRRGRTLYEVFTAAHNYAVVGPDATPAATPIWPDAGSVTTDVDGKFILGPFVAATPNEPGYWFLATESWEATPILGATPTWRMVGDIVAWLEYPANTHGVNENNDLPRGLVNSKDPVDSIPNPYGNAWFPVTLDEATPYDEGFSPTPPVWKPPRWYAVDTNTQYNWGRYGGVYDFTTKREGSVQYNYPYWDTSYIETYPGNNTNTLQIAHLEGYDIIVTMNGRPGVHFSQVLQSNTYTNDSLVHLNVTTLPAETYEIRYKSNGDNFIYPIRRNV